MHQQQWDRYSEYVLCGLKDLKSTQTEMWREINDIKAQDIADLKTELAVMKIKCGIWGAIGAACGTSVPFVAAIIYNAIK